MVHHIENEQIVSEVLKSDKLVVMDFFATWCGPCQMLSPVINDLDKEYDGEVNFYKVDIDENQESAMRYQVTSVPTLIFFKDGMEIERKVGLMPKNELKDFISEMK